MSLPLPSPETCQRARLSRDARFDGLFFTGVFSTGIYCRPVCPAPSPKEENVRYFATAQAAAAAGLRPCLRCRPESAPGSAPWRGTATTLSRAMALIDAGALNATEGKGEGAMEALSARLGVGSRYLRKLFQEQLGMSPKAYGDYRRLLLAKALLHQTDLPITEVAFMSGYGSLRRFNEVFKATLNLTPGQVRSSERSAKVKDANAQTAGVSLILGFRPPYDFMTLRQFFMARAIEGAEWFTTEEGEPCYGRTLWLDGQAGWFEARPLKGKNALRVQIFSGSDSSKLSCWLNQIKRVLDLETNLLLVAEQLNGALDITITPAETGDKVPILPVMALPGAGSHFEACCRAVLGQQVSLSQATRLLNLMVAEASKPETLGGRHCRVFPTPAEVAACSLETLKMPGARKLALQGLAKAFIEAETSLEGIDEAALLKVKGIGPWTVNYARMRGLSEPDVLLTGDLVVRQRLKALGLDDELIPRLAEQVSPWGSYLTLALWHMDLQMP